jgi:hypothetical protein
VLNLHQPAGNLENLLEADPWAAREILYALDRIPRSLWPYEDIGRVHPSISGTLLETLADPVSSKTVLSSPARVSVRVSNGSEVRNCQPHGTTLHLHLFG